MISSFFLVLLLGAAALDGSESYQHLSDMQVRSGWFKAARPDSATSSSTAFFPKVSGHSAASVLDPTKISPQGVSPQGEGGAAALLFGGLTGGAGSPCSDETWEFLAPQNEWKKLPLSSKPGVRMYAASAVLEDKLVMFGGWDPGAPGSGGEFLKDIWEFNVQTHEWTEVEAQLPFPVSRHTACTVNGMVVVHTYKGIFVYRKDGSLTEQETTGDVPDEMSMCAAAPLNDSQMIIFGGSTKNQQMSQDAYLLDTNTWEWTKLAVNENNNGNDNVDDRPPQMASSCAARVADNEIIIFGGAGIGSTGYDGGFGLVPQKDTWKLKVTNGGTQALWEKVEMPSSETCNTPEGRVAASLCPIGPSTFLLQGGFDPLTKTTFDEPWILSL